MLTGELKSQIDRIWDAFWSGGISTPLEVIEQITYLLFLRRLDDLRTLGGNGSTYAHHMKDARFTIPKPALLAKVVDLIDKVPMEDRDTKGDLYEYMLGKIATAGQNGQFRTPRHIIRLMVEMTAPGLNELPQLIFLEMFGEPVTNLKGGRFTSYKPLLRKVRSSLMASFKLVKNMQAECPTSEPETSLMARSSQVAFAIRLPKLRLNYAGLWLNLEILS